MSIPFAVIFDDSMKKEVLDDLLEVIRSSYVSKKANSNIFIIAAEQDSMPQVIFDNIRNKLKMKTGFIVVNFNNFYGSLPEEVFTWIKQTFPKVNLVSSESTPL